jgi:hypothetical protein
MVGVVGSAQPGCRRWNELGMAAAMGQGLDGAVRIFRGGATPSLEGQMRIPGEYWC